MLKTLGRGRGGGKSEKNSAVITIVVNFYGVSFSSSSSTASWDAIGLPRGTHMDVSLTDSPRGVISIRRIIVLWTTVCFFFLLWLRFASWCCLWVVAHHTFARRIRWVCCADWWLLATSSRCILHWVVEDPKNSTWVAVGAQILQCLCSFQIWSVVVAVAADLPLFVSILVSF